MWCDVCGGSGDIEGEWVDWGSAGGGYNFDPCPSCNATGLDPVRLERAIERTDPWEIFVASDGHNGIRQRDKREIVVTAITEYLRKDD